MYHRSRCLIIKNMDFRETDKLVTVFSEKEGKLTSVARGTKKAGSSLRACVQPFCHSFLLFGKGRGELVLITQGKLLDFYANIREDLDTMLYAVYIMELLDKSLMDREPLPRLYTTTLEVLELFNEFSYRPLIMRYFEMSLLKNLGYLPILDHCVLCGKNDEALQNFSLSEGGMLCRKCSAQSGPHISLTGEALALIRLLNTAKSKTLSRVKASDYALEKVEYFLEKFLEFHLERKFNMKNTIRTLKRKIPC